MNISDLAIPDHLDAVIDKTKNRIEILLRGESGGKIIAYYPIETLQIYLYAVAGTRLPDMWDLGLRTDLPGRYMRILICRHGRGEFSDKEVHLYLSGGEFALKCGLKEKNRFQFSSDNLLCVELVLQVDHSIKKSLLVQMLKTALASMGISEEDFRKNQWYFSDYSQPCEEAVDRLIANCMDGADSSLVFINASEIGYYLGNAYKKLKSKERQYPTNRQRIIADDIHYQLTENFGERHTAAEFSEKYGLSDTTVKSYFKNVYGYSFKEYQMKVRMEKAAVLLETTNLKQVEIALEIGYSNQPKFISAFKKYYQMTPSEYRLMKKLGGKLE